jgi:hypothetical protein
VTADVAPELRVHLHGAKAIKVGQFMRSGEPKPFEWKSTADVILDKVRPCKEAIVKT